MAKEAPLEDILDKQLIDAGIGGYERNVVFVPNRRFKADFWFKKLRLAVEVDGGIFMKGRSGHTSGVGYHGDRVRDQIALSHGIMTVRFTTPQVRNGEAAEFIRAYLPVREREVSEVSKQSFRSSLSKEFGQSTKNKRKGGK